MLIGIAIPFISKYIPGLTIIWDNAWTVGLLISLVIYTWMMKNDGSILSANDYEKITANNKQTIAS